MTTRYAICRREAETFVPVTATRYPSMTEAMLALVFEYADQLDYVVRLVPADPVPTGTPCHDLPPKES